MQSWAPHCVLQFSRRNVLSNTSSMGLRVSAPVTVPSTQQGWAHSRLNKTKHILLPPASYLQYKLPDVCKNQVTWSLHCKLQLSVETVTKATLTKTTSHAITLLTVKYNDKHETKRAAEEYSCWSTLWSSHYLNSLCIQVVQLLLRCAWFIERKIEFKACLVYYEKKTY